MTRPLPLETLICLAVDRMAVLARPPRGEPCPLAEGAPPADWGAAAGLGADGSPHPVIHGSFTDPLDLGPHNVETVAHVALQRLARMGMVEGRGGLPIRYRPIVR